MKQCQIMIRDNWRTRKSFSLLPFALWIIYESIITFDLPLQNLGLCSARSEWTLKKRSSHWRKMARLSLRPRRSPRYYTLHGLRGRDNTTSTEMLGPIYVLLTRKISSPLRLKSRCTHCETVHCICVCAISSLYS